MLLIVTLILSFIAVEQVIALSCRNEKNEFVDWYYIQKYRNSLDYAYIDANSARKPFKLVGRSLSCNYNCAFGATLSPLYDDKTSFIRVLWNDNPPSVSSTSGFDVEDEDYEDEEEETHGNLRRQLQSGTSGHTKGIIGGDETGGFLMTHSIPRFPDMSFPTFRWGQASDTYAQSILCISLNRTELDKAARGMQYNDPKTFSSFMPPGLSTMFPYTTQLIAGTRRSNSLIQTLNTVKGAKFIQFAKTGKSGIELYGGLVQPHLKVDMFVETWRRSPALDSFCRPNRPYNSINVEYLEITRHTGTKEQYRYTTDHSKWAVSTNTSASENWACVGDINRMSSQTSRGGGTVCTNCRILHYALHSLIKTTESCD